jgi:hypothetical protein
LHFFPNSSVLCQRLFLCTEEKKDLNCPRFCSVPGL